MANYTDNVINISIKFYINFSTFKLLAIQVLYFPYSRVLYCIIIGHIGHSWSYHAYT